jgi:hypothetical protein
VNDRQAFFTGILLGHLTEAGIVAVPVMNGHDYTEFIDIQLPVHITGDEAMVVRITIVPIMKGPHDS